MSDIEDACLCPCSKEVHPLPPGSEAGEQDSHAEDDGEDEEVHEDAAMLDDSETMARPAVFHASTLSCFYSKRELSTPMDAFEILNGDLGEPDLVKMERNRWAIEAREAKEMEEEREAKRRKTENAKVEVPAALDVAMKDAGTPDQGTTAKIEPDKPKDPSLRRLPVSHPCTHPGPS